MADGKEIQFNYVIIAEWIKALVCEFGDRVQLLGWVE